MAKVALTKVGNLYARFFIENEQSRLTYSMSLDSMIAGNMLEDPTLDVPMKIRSDGLLIVKSQFIEETRSYIVIPPIPPPSGSITYDDFESYTNFAVLNELNSGSNEWSNITPLAAYVAAEAYVGIKAGDDFESYADGTVVTASNMLMGGTGWWKDVYVSVGVDSWWREFYDDFESYYANTFISGSGSYTGTTTNRKWSGNWLGKTQTYGMEAYDDFELYAADVFISGSGYTPNSNWPWNGDWTSRNDITGSV